MLRKFDSKTYAFLTFCTADMPIHEVCIFNFECDGFLLQFLLEILIICHSMMILWTQL